VKSIFEESQEKPHEIRESTHTTPPPKKTHHIFNAISLGYVKTAKNFHLQKKWMKSSEKKSIFFFFNSRKFPKEYLFPLNK